MYLTRHQSTTGPRWALDGMYLPSGFGLGLLLELRARAISDVLGSIPTEAHADGKLLSPLDGSHEVWASGVTYKRSREARVAESKAADAYDRVYEAERPELFLKAIGWRVSGHLQQVRVRRDSRWDVPEPELVLVVNRHLEVVGYTAGNDVSSREIEGENTLYLPQAKIYDGSCALGPGIVLSDLSPLKDLPIGASVWRDGKTVFSDTTRVSRMKRGLEELVSYLGRDLSFPQGAFLMTGTGIVPPDEFSLAPGDEVQVTVGELSLKNSVLRATASGD